MDISTIVGLVLSFGLTFSAMLVGSSFGAFIDYPSLIFVLGGTFALTLASFTLPDVLALPTHVSNVFFPSKLIIDKMSGRSVDTHESEKLAQRLDAGAFILSRIRLYALAIGCVAFLIGAVKILAGLDDPETIGPAAALSLLSFLYSLLVAFFICLPLQSKMQTHAKFLREVSSPEKINHLEQK